MRKVTIAVTETCPHRQVLTRYFEAHGIPCEVKYIEESPEFGREHELTRSPNVLVENEVVCRGMPSPDELERIRQMCERAPKAWLDRP